MSVLNDVLTSADELEAAVNVCKNDILTHLERVYVEFSERPKRKKLLVNRLSALQEEISNVMNNLQITTEEDLKKAEIDLETHLKLLQKNQFTLEVVDKLYKVHEKLMEIKDLKGGESYFCCMKKILETEELIKNTTPLERLTVMEEFSLALTVGKSSLLKSMIDVFESHVILEPGENTSVLKISTKTSISDEILKGLYLYQTSVAPLDDLTKFLWNHVFIPVVDRTTEIKTRVDNNFMIMEVVTVDATRKSSYAEVFANIKLVLNFLSNNLTTGLDEELTSLRYIGRDLEGNLSELIIKHCLQDTVPTSLAELKKYSVVVEATEDLEKALVVADVFDASAAPLLEYVNKADVLFVARKCEEYASRARALMKKDLHDLVEVGEAVGDVPSEPTFPRCSVSGGLLELLRLMEAMLSEATSLPETSGDRLFRAVRDVCRVYVEFVPRHHRKLLQTIPQQVAVFRNNCAYLSHTLTGWNEAYPRSRFGDEQRLLEEAASSMFAGFVDGQIRQIEETMRGAGLRQRTLDRLEPSSEKVLRQCLRQQELLRTVWQRVLPSDVYNRSVGAILDALCKHVITALVKVEDVSTGAGEQLAEMLRMVQTRGAKLFADPKEVAVYVGSWEALNELVFVLGASLLEINDRWAEGKGPLALHFKPEELKQLIRALFQNTERRAALLAKI